MSPAVTSARSRGIFIATSAAAMNCVSSMCGTSVALSAMAFSCSTGPSTPPACEAPSAGGRSPPPSYIPVILMPEFLSL